MHSNTPTPRSAFLALLMLILSINAPLCAQSLSGQYTIGGASASYPTFRAAIHALDSFGVSGPVVFNVSSGTYRESDTIRPIAGSSKANTVTFQSLSGDSSDVVLEWNSQNSGNWNLWLFNTGHLIFNHIGFKQNFDNGLYNVLMVNCHDITFQHCLFTGSTMIFDGTLLSGTVDSNLSVLNSTFQLACQGINVSSEKKPATNLTFDGNYFHTHHGGLKVEKAQYLNVEANRFENLMGCRFTGLSIKNSKFITVSYNHFKVDASKSRSRAIDLQNITGDTATNSWVFNNIVNMTASGGMSVYSFKLGNASNTMIVHNTFKLNSPVTEHAVVRFYADPNGITDCFFYNNIVANMGAGPCYVYNNNVNTGLQSDYNLWYSGAGLITPTEGSLAAIFARNGSNANSLYADPLFESPDTLRSLAGEVDSTAFIVPHVAYDFEKQRRSNSNPDIGALENLHLPTVLLPNDTTHCGPLLISAQSDANWFEWNNGVKSQSITISSSGTYWVTGSNGDGRSTDTIIATIGSPIQITLQASADSISSKGCVTLSANYQTGSSLMAQWTDTLGLIKTQSVIIDCPLALPITYYCEITDTLTGCQAKDSITIYATNNSVFSTLAVATGGGGAHGQSQTSEIPGIGGGSKKSGENHVGKRPTEDFHKPSLTKPIVYPNPGHKLVYVQFPTTGFNLEKMYLSDLAGHLSNMPTTLTGAGLYEMEISHLPNGSYVLVIVTKEEVFHIQLEKLQP